MPSHSGLDVAANGDANSELAAGATDDELRVPLLSTSTPPPESLNRRDSHAAAASTTDADVPEDDTAGAVKTSVPTLLARLGLKRSASLFAGVLALGAIAVTSITLAMRDVRTSYSPSAVLVGIPEPGPPADVLYNSNTGCIYVDLQPHRTAGFVLPEGVPSTPPTHGRGIVVVAARQPNAGRFFRLWSFPIPSRFSKPSPQLPLLGVAAVRALRRVGCELPVEIWSEGANAGEIAATTSALADVANVTIHDGPISNSSSVIAAMRSMYSEVLVIPATAMAVADPTPLFESPQYLATGTLLWAQMFNFSDQVAKLNLSCSSPALGLNMFLVDKARASWNTDSEWSQAATDNLSPETTWAALRSTAFYNEEFPLHQLIESYLFSRTPFHMATTYKAHDPEACTAPISYAPALSSEVPRAIFVNVLLSRSDAIGETYFEETSSKCDGSIQSVLENAAKDSRMASKPMRMPTPGRLASVPYNCNLGDAYGDRSEQAEDLRVITPGQPDGPPLDGRAVLITASADQFVPLAVASARALRQTGSKLTVEIWAWASSEALANAASEITDLMDVSVHSLPPANVPLGSIIAAAAMQSTHREVFVIGATNFAITDPEEVFNSPEYLATGSLFWSKSADEDGMPSLQQQQRFRGLLPDAIVADMLLVDKARAGWSTKAYGRGDGSSSQGAATKLPHEAPWFALQSALASPYGPMDKSLSIAFIMNRTPFYLVLPTAEPYQHCLHLKIRRKPGAADDAAEPLFVAVTRVTQDLTSTKVFISEHIPECDLEIDNVYRKGLGDAGFMTKGNI